LRPPPLLDIPFSLMEHITQFFINYAASFFTAVTIAIIAFAWNLYRNKKLEKNLENGISNSGGGLNYDSLKDEGEISVIIENKSPVTIRVRKVLALGAEGQGYLIFNYSKRVSDAALMNAMAQEKGPKRIKITSHFPDEHDSNEYIVLTAYTGAVWSIDLKEIKEIKEKRGFIRDFWVIFEYPTIFGGSSLLRVHASEHTLNIIRNNAYELRKMSDNRSCITDNNLHLFKKLKED